MGCAESASRHGDLGGAYGSGGGLTAGGPVATVAETLDGYRDLGISEVIFVFRRRSTRDDRARRRVRAALDEVPLRS